MRRMVKKGAITNFAGGDAAAAARHAAERRKTGTEQRGNDQSRHDFAVQPGRHAEYNNDTTQEGGTGERPDPSGDG
jgi:hypothetical protein